MKLKITAIGVCVCILAGLAATYLYLDHRSKQQEKQVTAYRNEVADLEEEKENLEKDLQKLEEGYRPDSDQPTVTIYVKGLDSNLYDIVYKNLKEKKVTGMMLLSEDEFPGKSGCITEKQFSKMIDNGWRYSYYFDGTTSLTKYMETMSEQFGSIGFQLPDSLFYDNGLISDMNTEVAVLYGVNNIISYGTSASSVVTTEAVKGDLWTPGVVDWLDNSYDDYLTYAVDGCGSFATVITTSDRRCNTKRLVSFIDKLKEQNVKICTLSDARAFREKMYKSIEKGMKNDNTDRASIEKKIQKIDKQISDIQDKYSE